MDLYETVQLLCTQHKTTIAALERTLVFGNGTIKKWSKAAPSGDRLAKVADYFGVTTDYLLGRSSVSSNEEELPTYDSLLKIYTRGKNGLTLEEKMRLAQIILADRNDQ